MSSTGYVLLLKCINKFCKSLILIIKLTSTIFATEISRIIMRGLLVTP